MPPMTVYHDAPQAGLQRAEAQRRKGRLWSAAARAHVSSVQRPARSNTRSHQFIKSRGCLASMVNGVYEHQRELRAHKSSACGVAYLHGPYLRGGSAGPLWSMPAPPRALLLAATACAAAPCGAERGVAVVVTAGREPRAAALTSWGRSTLPTT